MLMLPIVRAHGPETTWHDAVPIRAYPRINVYLSEDFVSLVPLGYCQDISRLRRVTVVPLQTQAIVAQAWNLYPYLGFQR